MDPRKTILGLGSETPPGPLPSSMPPGRKRGKPRNYRPGPVERDALFITVQDTFGPTVNADFVSIEGNDLDVSIAKTKNTNYPEGRVLQLVFVNLTFRQRKMALGRVVSRVGEGSRIRYGLTIESDDDAAELYGMLDHLFNNRQAFRVRPDERKPVPVVLELLNKNNERTTREGTLLDVSTLGAGIRIPVEGDDSPLDETAVVLRMTLPGSAPVDLPGTVRYKLVEERHLRFGIKFDVRDTDRQVGPVSQYVMKRQRENAQRVQLTAL